MPEFWPALATLLALALLLGLIIRFHWHAFLALTVVSLALGLAGGLSPPRVAEVFSFGVGDILKEVAVLLALGAMLGRLLEVSGAASVIAQTLVDRFGLQRAPLALLLTAFLVGIPVLFNVGFLLLIPIVYRLQRQTGQSLLYYLLPLAFGLGMAHSLVPPHPGIIYAVMTLGGPNPNDTMVRAILFGSMLSLVVSLIGWYGAGLFWARRQFVPAPENLAGPEEKEAAPAAGRQQKGDSEIDLAPPSFGLAVLIVTLPLLLSLVGFGAQVFSRLDALPEWVTEPPLEGEDWYVPPLLAWLEFLGRPIIALLTPTLLAFWFFGFKRGMKGPRLSRLAEEALRDVGSMVFLFGAAGGFKEVILATGAGRIIGDAILSVPFLPPLVAAYVVAVLMRIALGSATASILTASALLVGLAKQMPGQETYLVLAVAVGVTFMTQPADSGFWMIKEYGNLSVRDVMIRFNRCRILMSLTGLAIVLLAGWLF